MNRRNVTLSLVPVGSHTKLTTSGSVVTLTRPMKADGLLLQNTGTADIFYTLDRSNPDATTGFLLNASRFEVKLDLFENNVNVWLINGAVLQYQWFSYVA